MKISLIICTYNRLDLLHKCILSIKAQSVLPDEIILSDDGSDTDIRSFFLEHSRLFDFPVSLVRQEHNGFRLARVRNNGVSVSTGDLLIFLDQDIVISPDYLRRFSDSAKSGRFSVSYPIRLTSEQSDLLTDKLILEGKTSSVVNKKQAHKPVRQYYRDKLNYYLCKTGLYSYGAKLRGGVSAIFRKDYQNVNGFDENFVGWGNEDDDLGRRLLASGVIGQNVTKHDYSYHLYHLPNHESGKRTNRDYNLKRINEISADDFRCQKGLNTERPDLQIFSN